MSSTNRKIVGLSAALAALAGPAALAPSTADAAMADSQQPDSSARPTLIVAFGDEFMSFTVGEDSSGAVVADHSSHASHSSHSSHSSHHSSR